MGALRIERFADQDRVRYDVLEEGVNWKGSSVPQPRLTVTLYPPRFSSVSGALRAEAYVSWPSTTDKDVALAGILGVALIQAAAEADQMNQQAILAEAAEVKA